MLLSRERACSGPHRLPVGTGCLTANPDASVPSRTTHEHGCGTSQCENYQPHETAYRNEGRARLHEAQVSEEPEQPTEMAGLLEMEAVGIEPAAR